MLSNGMFCLHAILLFPSQPNGAEEVYGMDQLSQFEEGKMKEVTQLKLVIMVKFMHFPLPYR